MPPDDTSGDRFATWDAYFSKHRPAPQLVGQWVLERHEQKQHERVIPLIEAALIHGQSQPWMYEVLALSMEIEGRPREEVERVVLSLSDFGQADYGAMMYSGAYLSRFNRSQSALKMHRQASRLLPERPEPYVLGLKLARNLESWNDIEWAACGILLHDWMPGYRDHHQEAIDAVLIAVRAWRRAGNNEAADRLVAAVKEAQSRDLMIRLSWSGDGDLDMVIEEPPETVCSIETPETISGGIYTHDGYGPQAENSYDEYVCSRGLSGEYRITIRQVEGKVVGNRATLTVMKQTGLPGEETVTIPITLEDGVSIQRIVLSEGRRKQPRNLGALERQRQRHLVPTAAALQPRRGNAPGRNRQVRQVVAEFVEGRMQPVARAGVFGVSPVIQVIPDGASLRAQAVVSPDRRYVRMALQPTFSTVTDVFTFSFLQAAP